VTRHDYALVDVFTDRKFGGNQLAVFGDGRGISTETMQAVAAELHISETTFVVPTEKDGDHRVRIFTPGRELPFAGHPTIGTTWVLTGGKDGALRLELGVGTLAVTIRSGFVEMEQPLPRFGPIVHDRSGVATSLSLSAEDDLVATSPIQEISSGLPHTYVHLRDLDAVRRVRVHRGIVRTAVYVFTTETVEPGSTLHARMFAGEALGVDEDPATGGAQGALAAYCVRYGIVPASALVRVRTEQGFELGRRSILDTRLSMGGAEITAVHVGGNVVPVGGGWMDL
jgi:trans-2,3-dihydro-3-hydroxyanthranilate isomerase